MVLTFRITNFGFSNILASTYSFCKSVHRDWIIVSFLLISNILFSIALLSEIINFWFVLQIKQGIWSN